MTALNQITRLALVSMLSFCVPAAAQYRGYTSPTGAYDNNTNNYLSTPGYNCPNGQCVPRYDSVDRPAASNNWMPEIRDMQSDLDTWRSPNASSGNPFHRAAGYRGTSGGEFPELPVSYSSGAANGYGNGRELDWRNRYGTPINDGYDRGLQDPFRGLNRGRNSDADPFGSGVGHRQTRYRIPLDRSNPDGSQFDSRDWNQPQLSRDRFIGPATPSYEDRYSPTPGRDPFVPAPTPIGRMDDEADAINKLISSRYSNPVNIRAIWAMSASQATNLFAEVSQRIDERHLQPTSYDVRVRRALRNLVMALDNPAFTQSLGISSDSFRLDGFRNTLSSMAGSMRVSNQSDARNVMNTVMQQAQTVPGLSPNVVAFEFANASIDTLDKFSGIEPKDPAVPGAAVEKETRNASLEDQIVGVGVEVKEDQRGLLVVKSLRGGPAEEAGIQSGDVIVSIDGRSIEGVPMVNSVDLMKGSAGSSMVVRIYRSGKGEKNFSLVRRSIRVWTVNDTRILDGTQIGYLSLSRFAQNSTAELDQALSELHSQGMNSLIIDLRGNPGGLLTTCVEISDRFLPCGTIVSTKGRLSTDNMLEQATWSRTWNTPLVVLVDGDSASASEIFAAAVQENQRGVVVGTNSYGKGTVQTHFPLNSISGNLRLTTAKFYSPNGREMAGQGVKPDVRVEDADGVANGDKVLMQAVRIAQSTQVQEMAKAAGTCRTGQPSAARSSSLENFNDPAHIVTAVR